MCKMLLNPLLSASPPAPALGMGRVSSGQGRDPLLTFAVSRQVFLPPAACALEVKLKNPA